MRLRLSHDERQASPERRLAAAVALGAMLLAILAITVAGVAIHGPDELVAVAESAAQGEAPRPAFDARTQEEREVDAAVTANRFATGLSP
jgi:hypothetical protein